MYTFETQMHALGVYFQVEVTFQFDGGDPSTNVPSTVDITDIWLIGCYPEGCESRAVDRNDYESVRIKADVGYLKFAEYAELIRRCQDHNAAQCEIAMERDYEI